MPQAKFTGDAYYKNPYTGPNPFGNAGQGPTPSQQTAPLQGQAPSISQQNPIPPAPTAQTNPTAASGGAFTSQGYSTPGYDQPLPGDFSLQNPGPAEQWDPSQYEQPFQAEQFQQQAGGLAFTPGVGELGTAAMIPGIQAPGVGQMYQQQSLPGATAHQGDSNMSAQMFQDFQRTAGTNNPGMGAYYDNAGRQALEAINQNAAARGVYGSSAALSQGQEALTNLAADRARNEADYNLRRLQTGGQLGNLAERSQLDWFGRTGDMAMDAERLGLDRQGMALDAFGQMDDTALERMRFGLDAATAAGDEHIGRLTGRRVGAESAQGAREGRIGLAGEIVGGNARQQGSMFSDAYQDILEQDMAFQDAIAQAIAAGDLAKAQDLERQRQQNKDLLNFAGDIIPF